MEYESFFSFQFILTSKIDEVKMNKNEVLVANYSINVR